MAGYASYSDISYALKTTYPEQGLSAISQTNNTWNAIKRDFGKTPKDKVGLVMEYSVEMGYGGGFGALGSSYATLPDHGFATGVKATPTVKRLTHRTAYAEEDMRLADTEFKAFRNLWKEKEDAQGRAFERHLNRMVFGRSSGALCQANGAGSAATALIVDSFVTGRPIHKLFNIGDQIDVFTAETAGTQQLTKVTITGVNAATSTLTLASAQTWSDNSYVFFAGCRGNELTGFSEMIDDGTLATSYAGISRTTYPLWRSTVVSGAATATLAEMNSLIQQAGKNGRPNRMVTTFELKAKLINEAATFNRFTPRASEKGSTVNFGYEDLVLSFGVAVSADEDCPSGTVYAYDTESMVITSPMTQPEYMDKDGSMFARIANTMAYETTLYFLADLFCKNPNRCFKRTNLS